MAVLCLVGGVAVFLFGMELLCAGLERISRPYVHLLCTHSFVRSMFLSALFTACVQSSSAVTVMIAGLAASNVLPPERSLGLIAGANIGTCATAFLVHAGLHIIPPVPPIAPVFLLVFLPFLVRRTCPVWLCLCGGVPALLCGMSYMQAALVPLSDTSFFSYLCACHTPLYGLLAGAVMTAVLQSSSACIALLQAANGMLTIGLVFPLLLGQNIGTCVTALLASLGMNAAARQTARLHLLFNVIGAAALFPFFLFMQLLFPSLIAQPADSSLIAWMHLFINLSSALLFYLLRRPLSRHVIKSSSPPVQRAA